MFLSETPNSKINLLLYPHSYKQLRDRLKTLLSKEEYQFFAIPDRLTDTTNWTTDIPDVDRQFGQRGVKSYNELTDEDKDEISDYIETIKEKITAKICDDKTFTDIHLKLFLMPDTADIKIVKTEEGIIPVLTQWGCKSNETTSTIDPLAVVINRPRANSAKVIVHITYTDGSTASDRIFYIDYLGKPLTAKTNKDGLFNYGRLKLEAEFLVYDIVNNQKSYAKDFKVTEPGEFKANVVFPLLVSGTIKVVNQKDTPLSNREVIIDIEGEEKQKKATDKTGKISLDRLEVGKQITITEKENAENTQTYTIEKDGNIFKLVIVCPIPTVCTIIVQDEGTGKNQTHYPVLVEYNGSKKEYSTGEEAIINIKDLTVGNEIKISDKNKIDNYQIHKLNEQGNDYILKIVIPKPRFFKIRVIEHRYFIPFIWGRKKNLENIVVDFINNKGEKVTRTTDKYGYCSALPEDEFDNDKKIKALIHIVKSNRKGKKKEKIVTRTFILKKEQ